MSLSAAQNQSSPAGTTRFRPRQQQGAVRREVHPHITIHDIAAATERGEKWPMLTASDAMTASVFDEAGIPVMLVGDSMGNVHLGYETTVPVTATMDEIAILSAAAVVRGTKRALVVDDLPAARSARMPSRRCATRPG
ncbi:3-methyl-2-oxobutanoate hydroxymethyltransferase OS=Streptomyces microflavus OX=1919 GN=panB PE=3 SV=1 [Streptomyces microflavus]